METKTNTGAFKGQTMDLLNKIEQLRPEERANLIREVQDKWGHEYSKGEKSQGVNSGQSSKTNSGQYGIDESDRQDRRERKGEFNTI